MMVAVGKSENVNYLKSQHFVNTNFSLDNYQECQALCFSFFTTDIKSVFYVTV